MRPRILFDLSEVLVGGFYGIEQIVARAEGISADRVRPIVAGPNLWALCSGNLDEDTYLGRILTEGAWTRLTKEGLSREIRTLFRATIPGMPEYLAELSKTCDLYLLSDHAREWIPDVVSFHPFMALFKKRYYSFEVGSVKREGRPFRYVLDDLGIEAKDLFFVDDSAANVAKAREYGIEAVVFKSRAELEPVLEGWIRQVRKTA